MGSYICQIDDLGELIKNMGRLAEGTQGSFRYKEKEGVILKLKEYPRIKWYYYCDNAEGNTIRLYDSEFYNEFSKLYKEPKDYVILRGYDLGKARETLKQKIRDLFESMEKPPPEIKAKHPDKCLPYFEERNKRGMKIEERQNKCWRYSRNPDDKNDKDWYIFAFVNAMGACSLTRFKASDGKYMEMLLNKRGDFQDNFPEYLNPTSFPLRLSHQPNIVEARKEGLPVWAMSEIRKQVIELATSSLLALFGCC